MVRAVLVLAVSLAASAFVVAGASAQQSPQRTDGRGGDDSFLYAPSRSGVGRVPNYVADSAKGQPLDYSDRRRFERPYLSGEPVGLQIAPP